MNAASVEMAVEVEDDSTAITQPWRRVNAHRVAPTVMLQRTRLAHSRRFVWLAATLGAVAGAVCVLGASLLWTAFH